MGVKGASIAAASEAVAAVGVEGATAAGGTVAVGVEGATVAVVVMLLNHRRKFIQVF